MLDLVEDLERRDGEIAASLAHLAELSRRAEAVRARAGELGAFLDRVPAEQEYLAGALAEAEQALAAARGRVAEAERALAEASDRERERAEEEAGRARAAAFDAEAKVERLAARRAALDEDAETARADAAALEDEARAVAGELAGAPRLSSSGAEPPRGGLEGLVEWGSRAAAALLVARAGLERDRDATVREAQELAASVLGEHVGASSVAVVRERLARELG